MNEEKKINPQNNNNNNNNLGVSTPPKKSNKKNSPKSNSSKKTNNTSKKKSTTRKTNSPKKKVSKERNNTSKEEIKTLLADETWLTASEALEKGFCDEIEETEIKILTATPNLFPLSALILMPLMKIIPRIVIATKDMKNMNSIIFINLPSLYSL